MGGKRVPPVVGLPLHASPATRWVKARKIPTLGEGSASDALRWANRVMQAGEGLATFDS